MRHLKSGRKLNRNASHRKAMFRNMAASLITHELIKTTIPKAKELRRVVEPLITLAKVDSVSNRRLAFSRIRDKEVVSKLFTEVGPRFSERPGGYLRILKSGFRKGDSAPMAWVQLVDSAIKTADSSNLPEEEQNNTANLTDSTVVVEEGSNNTETLSSINESNSDDGSLPEEVVVDGEQETVAQTEIQSEDKEQTTESIEVSSEESAVEEKNKKS